MRQEFISIYEEHKSMVYNLCLNYLKNKEDAEEIVQDVFIKVFEKLDSFKGESSLKTWVYRITINLCKDKIKSRSRKKRGFLFGGIFNADEQLEHLSIEFNHPGVLLEDKEALEALFNVIDQLPPNQKTAILLRSTEHLSIKEIAEVMNMSEKAVESLLSRAKKSLKEIKTKD